MRNHLGRDSFGSGRESSGYIHTDPNVSKKGIGAPNAEDVFYAEHLEAKKQSRRERKKESRLEKAREAKARAMESIAREFESGEATEGIESLFADGQMDISSWLDRYYKAVQKSDTSEAILTDERLRDFTKGVVISRRIADDIEQFLGADTSLFSSDDESKDSVNFDSISGKLEISKEDAIKLVALVSFNDSVYILEKLFKYRNEPSWDFLNSRVSEEEFSALQKLFKDASFVEELMTELIRENAVLIERIMPPKRMDIFIRIHLMSNGYMDQSESQAFFGTDAVKQKYLSLFEKDKIAALGCVGSYEFLFGELSKDEFLKLFPDWHTAKSYEYYLFENRYGLNLLGGEDASGGREASASEVDETHVDTTHDNIAEDAHVRVLPERRILELLEQRPESAVADCVAPYVERTSEEAGSSTDRQKDAQREPRRKSDAYFFTPYERDVVKYIDTARVAREQMELEPALKERLHTFFADVWPHLLIARADGVVNSDLMAEIQKTIELLQDTDTVSSGTLAKHLTELVELSGDVGTNIRKIEALAAKLRNDETLLQNGIYVHAEVLHRSRERGTEKQAVSLLSSVSYEIDQTHEFNVDGKTTQIHELGKRIDTLNQDAPGLGFTYTGDNHGVVLRGVIRENVNRNVIPYLREETQYLVAKGERIHPLSVHIKEALRRDFPENPNEGQIQAIYQSSYKSTRDHEQQHKEDEVRGVQSGMRGAEARIAQETTAYLRSMAGRPEDAEPNSPFVNLASLIQLYISRSTDSFAVFADPHRIYEKASGRILNLIADALPGIEMDPVALENDPVQACNHILEEALKLDRNGLRALAEKISKEEIARQKGGRHVSKLESRQQLIKDEDDLIIEKPRENVQISTTFIENETQEDRAAVEMSLSIPEYTPDNPADKKTVRRNLRGAIFSATLVAALFVLKGDSAEHAKGEPATTDDMEMPTKASESSANESDSELKTTVLKENGPAPTVTPPGLDSGDLDVRKSPREDVDLERLEHISTDAERKSFGRGVWGYAEHVLRAHGLRKEINTDYTQKVAKLTDIFLGVLEGEGMVKCGKDGNTWYVPVSGEGVDKIMGVLRAVDISSFI